MIFKIKRGERFLYFLIDYFIGWKENRKIAPNNFIVKFVHLQILNKNYLNNILLLFYFLKINLVKYLFKSTKK